MTRKQHAQPLGALIPGILKTVEKEHAALTQVQKSWRSVAGRELAAHTRPISLRRGRLVVAAADPGGNYVLRFERTRIVEQLRQLTGGKVDELVVRPGSGSPRGKRTSPKRCPM